MRRIATGIGLGTALMLCACAESEPAAGQRTHALAAEAPTVETTRLERAAVDNDRLARLEARLEQTESRLKEAEARASEAEARARDALARGLVANGALARPEVGDPTVDVRSDDEIKAAATGIDDGAAGPVPVPEAPAYDDRLDPHKAAAFNVDPPPDD